MSRTNPYKKKKRTAKNTVLFFVEGFHEQVFFQFLKGKYGRNTGVRVSIKNAKGGNPDNMACKAMRIGLDYDYIYIIIDGDVLLSDKLRKLVKDSKKTTLVENKPCLETMLLNILESNHNFFNYSSKKCKKEFQKKYIRAKDRGKIDKYTKVFNQALLEEARSRVSNLDIILSVLEGNIFD